MRACVNCGQPTNGKTLKLSRITKAHHIPLTPVTVFETKNGTVPLCDDCNVYFSRANNFRTIGFLIFLGILFLIFVITVLFSAQYGCYSLALLPIGIALVMKGRSRLAMLERKVRF